ncbi:MAG: hypothetical protein K0S74_455 [Chlamydiales bacterium]|nr:hypothetical protein [Chlamydiales bacterium]
MSSLLGDYHFDKTLFSNIDSVVKQFDTNDFQNLNERQRSEKVNRILLDLIQQAPADSFLLAAVIDYLEKVKEKKVLGQVYNFNSFELWLNQSSGLSPEQNSAIRAKIAGKGVPRSEYQSAFPIGMNKFYQGSHFVTAHISPDIDTTVASFWSWFDAFAARVTEGLHVWNLPGGVPPSQAQLLFDQLFGEPIFDHIAKPREELVVTSMDLVTQKGIIKKYSHELTSSIDQKLADKAVLVIDNEGFYLGDWHGIDIESIRMIIFVINNCLRWFENNFQVNLISLFNRTNFSKADLNDFIKNIFAVPFLDCEPVKELTDENRNYLNSSLMVIFGLEKGIKSSFSEFSQKITNLSLFEFNDFKKSLESLGSDQVLFGPDHTLGQAKSELFSHLERLIKALDGAVHSIRTYLDRLDVALKIKQYVLGEPLQYVTLRSDLDEIKAKINSYQHVTVAYTDSSGRLNPVGVILASDIRKAILGTVSLRDFCNSEEIKITPYLEVISVVDHHKSKLQTSSAPVAIVGDVQSCNVLLAELAMQMYDKYSTGGIDSKEIEKQIVELTKIDLSVTNTRLLQRLLQKRVAASQQERGAFVNSKREFTEYLCYLYAIIDDTDLLSKVSDRDVECVKQLLNRMKTISIKKEVEIISFDHLERNAKFAKEAAKVILQDEDMYSIYKKTYEVKEKEVDQSIQTFAQEQPSNFFDDTKEQNGCCRVGQSKIFAKNYGTFLKHQNTLRALWLKKSQEINQKKPVIDLFLHLISTIVGADEVFSGKEPIYAHKDELWLWVPSTRQGLDHLASYLNAFRSAPELKNSDLEVEFLGPNSGELENIFVHSFNDIPRKVAAGWENGAPIAVLRYKAGLLNSRKAAVSPYIPTLPR